MDSEPSSLKCQVTAAEDELDGLLGVPLREELDFISIVFADLGHGQRRFGRPSGGPVGIEVKYQGNEVCRVWQINGYFSADLFGKSSPKHTKAGLDHVQGCFQQCGQRSRSNSPLVVNGSPPRQDLCK